MELLDHLLTFSSRQLEAVIREFLVHITRLARTTAQEHHCPDAIGPAPAPLPGGGRVVRHDRLGGLLDEYSRAA